MSFRLKSGGVAKLGEHRGGGEDSMGKGGRFLRKMVSKHWTKQAKKMQFALIISTGSFTNVLLPTLEQSVYKTRVLFAK